MLVLIQFLFRVSFGLATAMAATSARQVTSGYFRNHLYVILGLNVLGTLVAASNSEQFALWPPLTLAILGYVGSVLWLYEQPRLGKIALVAIAAIAIYGAWLAWPSTPDDGKNALVPLWHWLDPLTGGLTLGTNLAAMFLGHWYLNSPGMKMAPLKRLTLAIMVALFARGLVCGAGLAFALLTPGVVVPGLWFLVLRWSAGLVGALVVAIMAWETLKIPNTQSATGILYVGVILTFIGELCSLLMSRDLPLAV